jgi:hypothetical protein
MLAQSDQSADNHQQCLGLRSQFCDLMEEKLWRNRMEPKMGSHRRKTISSNCKCNSTCLVDPIHSKMPLKNPRRRAARRRCGTVISKSHQLRSEFGYESFLVIQDPYTKKIDIYTAVDSPLWVEVRKLIVRLLV